MLKMFASVAAVCATWNAFASEELRILSDRTESHLKPIFAAYQKKTGIKVSAIFLDKGLIERLESKPKESALIISKDADLLALAKTKKLLQPIKSNLLTKMVPSRFHDKDSDYIVDAYRARVIFYSKERVKPEQLSTYEDLASAKWRGKLCIRSGFHDYNLSLFGQMLATFGMEKTKSIIAGYHTNLAREPKGNDRDQAKAIMEGKCDVALMNTYYFPIMQSIPEQKSWADATAVFFPEQKTKGSFIMRSAAGIPRANQEPKAATAFLEYLLDTEAQEIMKQVTFQYPVNSRVQAAIATHSMGTGQPEVQNGQFKMNFVPLEEIAKYRDEAMKLVIDTNFDKL